MQFDRPVSCAYYVRIAQAPRDAPMQQIYDTTAPKKPTNLSINSDLLNEAKALKINLSATLEAALLNELKNAHRNQWLAENRQAIDACNQLAESHGLFADKHRVF